jgi:AcrR family transcriptional regulator
MPRSPERIAQEREIRRARIADTAMRLFAEHGFAAVSVEQIAAACKYTRVSVYNHFRGKPMIYLYLVRRGCAELARQIAARVRPEVPAHESFAALLDCFVELVEREPSFYELYFLERERVLRDMSAEERAELDTAHFSVERPARAMFERGIAAGVYKGVDAATATNLFFASFAGTILLYRTHRFRANLRELIGAVGHYLFRGLEAGGGAFPLPTRELPPDGNGGEARSR